MTLKLCDMSEREEHVLVFNGFIKLPKSTLRNKSRTFGEKNRILFSLRTKSILINSITTKEE